MKVVLSKKLITSTMLATLALGIGVGAYADSALQQVTAYQNANLAVKVNGKQIDQSSEDGVMYPLVYNGHSYISAKALAEAMGGKVTYDDSTKTVNVSTGGYVDPNAGAPTKDNSGSKPGPAPSPSQTTPSSNSASSSSANQGTISDPVKLGTTFTYTDYQNYEEGQMDTSSAQYSVTVNKVTPISADDIVALGYKRPETNGLTSFVMIDVSLKVQNATLKAGSNKDELGYKYLTSYIPDIFGVKTADGNSLIGGTDYGFDGSLDSNIHNVLPDFPKVTPGDSKSYEASGKIILTVFKGQDNLFVLQRSDTTLDYDKRLIFFKLQ